MHSKISQVGTVDDKCGKLIDIFDNKALESRVHMHMLYY